MRAVFVATLAVVLLSTALDAQKPRHHPEVQAREQAVGQLAAVVGFAHRPNDLVALSPPLQHARFLDRHHHVRRAPT